MTRYQQGSVYRQRPQVNRASWLTSILLHALVLLYWANKPITHTAAQDPGTILIAPLTELDASAQTDIPVPKARQSEIVETQASNNIEVDPNTTFLSDRNQTAQRQTRARLTDDFRKGQGSGISEKQSDTSTPRTGDPYSDHLVQGATPSDIADPKAQQNPGVKRSWRSLSLKDLSVDTQRGLPSATDDRLQGVDVGENTVLSTREFKYYSYYHRIKELLRQHWKPNVERKLAMLWGKGKSITEQELTTGLLVLLDNKGSIQKISKLASSGVVDLDDAAIEAFQRAAPFAHPPAGIIDEDGFVRIRWDFILKTESVPRIQFRNVSNPYNLR